MDTSASPIRQIAGRPAGRSARTPSIVEFVSAHHARTITVALVVVSTFALTTPGPILTRKEESVRIAKSNDPEEFEIGSQEAAEVVIAMARMMLEDAGLVVGENAELTPREARALLAHTDRTVN